jgi:hypothetical protein
LVGGEVTSTRLRVQASRVDAEAFEVAWRAFRQREVEGIVNDPISGAVPEEGDAKAADFDSKLDSVERALAEIQIRGSAQSSQDLRLGSERGTGTDTKTVRAQQGLWSFNLQFMRYLERYADLSNKQGVSFGPSDGHSGPRDESAFNACHPTCTSCESIQGI